jgi:tetratricopeptide (TPR) repeat protein
MGGGSTATSPPAAAEDPDYAAGRAAFEREDWRAAIASLSLVPPGGPREDEAQTMVAYAWRKLGRYDLALENYAAVLGRNPRHRGALEYLGEAYLDLGRLDDADATRARLAQACEAAAAAPGAGCEELEELERAYAEHGVPVPRAGMARAGTKPAG